MPKALHIKFIIIIIIIIIIIAIIFMTPVFRCKHEKFCIIFLLHVFRHWCSIYVTKPAKGHCKQ